MIAKFFMPDGSWVWFAFEGESIVNEKGVVSDYRFFGMVHGLEKELGYFTLSELKQVRGALRLPIERDRFVFKVPYGSFVRS